MRVNQAIKIHGKPVCAPRREDESTETEEGKHRGRKTGVDEKTANFSHERARRYFFVPERPPRPVAASRPPINFPKEPKEPEEHGEAGGGGERVRARDRA